MSTPKSPSPTSEQLIALAAALASMDPAAQGKTQPAPTFVREGTRVVLPPGMSHKELRTWSERVEKDEESMTSVSETFPGFPFDTAVHVREAVDEVFGFSTGATGFFDSSSYVSVRTGPNPGDMTQVPWGDFDVPALGKGGKLHIFSNSRSAIPNLIIAMEFQKKHRALADLLITNVRSRMRADSIYKGKAFRPTFDYLDEERPFHIVNDSPTFIDLSGVDRSRIVYSDQTRAALDISLFTPLTKPNLCRQYNIPLKRSVLLTGPYGVGKTLTARAAALEATRNGWTFIHLENPAHLANAYRLAATYAPAVVFCEDIDSQIPEGERTEALNEILNVVDGVEFKRAEVLLLLTTNHLPKIHSAMLRPGRIDTLVEITPPDAAAAINLVQLYSDGLLDPTVDLTPVGTALAGKIPAVIAETVKMAKLTALSRTDSIMGRVLPSDIVQTATLMENHIRLLEPKPVPDPAVTAVRHEISIATAGALTALHTILGASSRPSSLEEEALAGSLT